MNKGKEFEGKRILVVGFGESGYASARVLSDTGAQVKVVDKEASPALLDKASELSPLGVEVSLGVDFPPDMPTYDMVVTSPGVPQCSEVLQKARGVGIPVISELELGYRLVDGDIVAVTGTNGKTTTVSIIEAILVRAGMRAFACGNIGKPLVGMFGRTNPGDILVVEVSSFQLANIDKFRAPIALALNLAEDHLDWHRDMDEYREAKMRLIENTETDDFFIYNRDDQFTRDMAAKAISRKISFGLGQSNQGMFLRGDVVFAGPPFDAGEVFKVSELSLVGLHNISNAMAAAAAALCLEVNPTLIREALHDFKGMEHRLEFVDKVDGVSFYNDSKATNPHAAIQAMRSFEEPMILIMGGRNKGLDLTNLAVEVLSGISASKIKGVVLLGESGTEILSALGKSKENIASDITYLASDIFDAVKVASEMARGSGIVLFAPACASFDMFSNYEERGEAFKESVKSLKQGAIHGRAG